MAAPPGESPATVQRGSVPCRNSVPCCSLTTLIPLAACGPTDVASPGEGTIVVAADPAPAPPPPPTRRRRARRPRAARPATIDRGVVGTRRACELPSRFTADTDPPEPAGRRLLDVGPGQCRHRLRRRSRRQPRRLPAGHAHHPGRHVAVRARPAATIWWSTAARGSTRSARRPRRSSSPPAPICSAPPPTARACGAASSCSAARRSATATPRFPAARPPASR